MTAAHRCPFAPLHQHRLRCQHVLPHHRQPRWPPHQAPLACQHHSSPRCSSKWLPLLAALPLALLLVIPSAMDSHLCSVAQEIRRPQLQPLPHRLHHSSNSPTMASRRRPMSRKAPALGKSNSSCNAPKVNRICPSARASMRRCDSARCSIICSK